MKQLTDLLSSTVSNFNPVRTLATGFLFLRGKWRMYWNYCPECNSFAPKLHHCDVCHHNTKAYFDWNKDIAHEWWRRYTEKHSIGLHRFHIEDALHNHPKTSKAIV